MNNYRIVRKDNGHDNPQTGIVSEHRTLGAAVRRPEAGRQPFDVQELVEGAWQSVPAERINSEQYNQTEPKP